MRFFLHVFSQDLHTTQYQESNTVVKSSYPDTQWKNLYKQDDSQSLYWHRYGINSNIPSKQMISHNKMGLSFIAIQITIMFSSSMKGRTSHLPNVQDFKKIPANERQM